MKKRLFLSLLVALTAVSAQNKKTGAKPETKAEGETAQNQPAQNEQDRKIEVLAQEIEKLKAGKDLFPQAKEQGRYGLGPAASKVYEVNQGVSIGGYGEFLYTKSARSNESGTPVNQNDRFDTLRNILYVGYKFNDKFVFNSEIEFEHAGGGEVYTEFAAIDYLAHPMLNFKAGLLLIPMGIYNEMHEAPTFLATTRPLTESRIIPSTWRENGAGVFGQIGDFTYKLYGVTSLDARNSTSNSANFTSQGLRGGRQKGANAISNEFSGVLRIDYVGLPWGTFGASGYWGKSGQADNHEHETTIVDAHADLRFKGIYARAVVSWAGVTGADRVVVPITTSTGLADQMYGAYIELGYDIFRFFDIQQELYPHVRIERIDTQFKVAEGRRFDAQYEQNVLTFGFAYKPIRQISAKVDYSIYSNKADTGVNQLNFALGYLF